MHIDFILDTVCIWSYIAKRRLDAAIKDFPKLKVRFSVRPFPVLSPLFYSFPLPEGFLPDAAEKTRALKEKIEPVARKEGLIIAFDDLPAVSDSSASRRLVAEAFAASQTKGLCVLESVFHAYFCEARDISDPAVLDGIAKESGLNGFTADDISGAVPQPLPPRLKKAAVRAVPCLIFDHSAMICGAQSTETFKKMIELCLVLKKETSKSA